MRVTNSASAEVLEGVLDSGMGDIGGKHAGADGDYKSIAQTLLSHAM